MRGFKFPDNIRLMSMMHVSPMARRLMPLYISAFLQSIPFWYAIEKLFMTEIGFDTASIGIMVAVMGMVMLAVETPSGIMADRWSRKGVMLLGCLALVISAVAGGFSYNEPMYILKTIFWGIYAALYSGTYDSVIYDTTIEEEGSSERYDYFLGRLRAVEGTGFVVGAIGGGLLANSIGMRETYFLSLPFLIIGGMFLMRFREPRLHKAEIAVPVLRHIRKTFAAVLRKRSLLPIVVATVGFAVIQETLDELSQLWFIEVSTPLALYGFISAVLFSTWALGGVLAGHLRSGWLLSVAPLFIFLCIIGLITARNYWPILLAQFLLGTWLIALSVILSRKLHDELPSNIRAGSSSVISTLGRSVLIPASILFTYIANEQTIFTATYMLLAIAAIAVFAYALVTRKDAAVVPIATR